MLALLLSSPATAQFFTTEPDSGTVSVTATEEVMVSPGRAILSASFSATSIVAEDAVAEVAAARDRAIEALRRAGIPEEHIALLGVGFGPESPRGPRRPPEPGEPETRQALLGLEVKVTDLSRLEAVLSALAAAGMETLLFVELEPADAEAAQARATRHAVESARSRAEAMAAAAGASLGPIRSMATYPDMARDVYRMAGYSGPFEQFARLIPSPLRVTSTVHVAWELVR